MSNLDIFRNSTKTVPTSDAQIVRVAMDEIQIQGRKDHLPATQKSPELPLNHVPNAGSTPGGSA
jgi:hypothetical protein